MADQFKDILNAMNQGNGSVVMSGSGTNANVNGKNFTLAPQTSTNADYGTWREWADDTFKTNAISPRIQNALTPTRIAESGEEEEGTPARRKFKPKDWLNGLSTKEAANMKRRWKRQRDTLGESYPYAWNKLIERGYSEDETARKLNMNENEETEGYPDKEAYDLLEEFYNK